MLAEYEKGIGNMSRDFYIQCAKCKDSVWIFTNFDRNPQYLELMRFIMEHFGNGNCDKFNILDENDRFDVAINYACESRLEKFGDPPHPEYKLKALSHVTAIIECDRMEVEDTNDKECKRCEEMVKEMELRDRESLEEEPEYEVEMKLR